MPNRNNTEKEEIFWVAGFFVVLIILNFLIVHSFADNCSSADQSCIERLNPWYVFFMRFQTLITGLLAIVAALITVREMRKSVEHAEKLRNEENDRRNRRRLDGLRILHLCHANTLESGMSQVLQLTEYVTQLLDPDVAEEVWTGQDNESLRTVFEDTRTMLQHNNWDEFSSVLSSEARAAHTGLIQICEDGVDTWQPWMRQNYYFSAEQNFQDTFETFADLLQSFHSYARIIREEISNNFEFTEHGAYVQS